MLRAEGLSVATIIMLTLTAHTRTLLVAHEVWTDIVIINHTILVVRIGYQGMGCDSEMGGGHDLLIG